MYFDSRYKTSDSIANSGLKFEIKGGLNLPDNTVCYIDNIPIPHTWYTIEYYNSIMCIEMSNPDLTLSYSLITVPRCNCTSASLVS